MTRRYWLNAVLWAQLYLNKMLFLADTDRTFWRRKTWDVSVVILSENAERRAASLKSGGRTVQVPFI